MVLSAQSARLVEEGGRKKIVMGNAYIFSPVDASNLLLMAAPTATQILPTVATMSLPDQLQMQTIEELIETEKQTNAAYGEGLRIVRNRLREIRQEIAKRIAFPLACLAVSLVAAPLAVRSHRGGRSYSFAAGFGIALTFYLLYFALEPKSLKSMSEVMLRSLAPSIVLSLVGAWLLWRVDRV
jgi:lipopolysaccharide export LptBFGC system permease protein LptF